MAALINPVYPKPISIYLFYIASTPRRDYMQCIGIKKKKKGNDGCPQRSGLSKNYISYFSSVLVLYVNTPVGGAPIVRRKIHSTRQDKIDDTGYPHDGRADKDSYPHKSCR